MNTQDIKQIKKAYRLRKGSSDIMVEGGKAFFVNNGATTLTRVSLKLPAALEGTYSQDSLRAGAAIPSKKTVAPEEAPQTCALIDLHRLKGVALAASKDPNRIILCGVLIEQDCYVATDGRRLHRTLVETEGLPDNAPSGRYGEPGVVIPSDVVQIALKMSPKKDRFARLLCEKNKIGLAGSWGEVWATSEGNYPNYKQVIPKDPGEHCYDFTPAVSLVKGLKLRLDLLKTTPEGLRYTLQGAKEETTVANPAPCTHGTSANVNYLRDAVTFTGGKARYKDELSPLVFTSPDGLATAIVMPLRLN